jgi:hypothetical protein
MTNESTQEPKPRLCKFCRQEIDPKAIVCPHCRHRLTKSTWALWLILVIVVGLVGGAVWLAGKLSEEREETVKGLNRDAQGLRDTRALIKEVTRGPSEPQAGNTPVVRPSNLTVLEAPYFALEYQNNEVRSDRQYKGRTVAVKGVVASVGKDIRDEPYIALFGPDEITQVQCYFDKADEGKLARLNTGDIVTVAGTCDGKFGNVRMKHCWKYAETVRAGRP